jgi:hypothetical protein
MYAMVDVCLHFRWKCVHLLSSVYFRNSSSGPDTAENKRSRTVLIQSKFDYERITKLLDLCRDNVLKPFERPLVVEATGRSYGIETGDWCRNIHW